MLGALRGCGQRRLQRCRRRFARELSPGFRTPARTPGGSVLRLHGDRSDVAQFVVVHPGGY